MNIVSIECPNCGGRIPRQGSEYFVRCPYCDTEVAFNEIKEEAQIDALKDRLDAYEQMADDDETIRRRVARWIMVRNISLSAMGVLHFFGFSLVGASDYAGSKKELLLGFGSVFCLIAWVLAFCVPAILGYYYHPYNVLTHEPQKAGRLKTGIMLAIIGLAILVFSAFAAFVLMRVLGMA